jgi:hypothetical protein
LHFKTLVCLLEAKLEASASFRGQHSWRLSGRLEFAARFLVFA